MSTMNNKLGSALGDEARSLNVAEGDRYVVCLAASYGETAGIRSVEQAAAALLAATLDGESAKTIWFVYDRQTDEHHMLDQGDIEDIMYSRGMI